jgi:hypothetical protein
MTSRQERSHWRPADLVLQALQQSLDTFIAGFESPYLLMVLLDAPDSELALGLQLPSETVAVGTDTLAFRTAALSVDDEGPTVASARARPSEATATARPSLPNRSVPTDRIPAELRARFCHFVPIQKRDKDSFLQHVSVGRARNHDIVLRQDSVSKFHAWFELAPDASLLVKDFDSKNRTFIDGVLVDKRTQVEPGQTVRFGSVECRVTTPATLWTALRR